MVKSIKLFLFLLMTCALTAQAYTYQTVRDISYRENAPTAYASERCKLDIYYPVDKEDFATVVWYHGGGLTGGQKEIPAELLDKGIAVVGVNYRLCDSAADTAVTTADCVDDAAAAAAWVMKHIADFGGDPSKVILAGHSAGGYLVMMIGLDKSRLAKYDIDPDSFAALVPFSGQAITHFQNRRDRGMSELQPLIDENAPLYYVRGDCPPILLICGQRERELLGRYEENAYLWRMFQLAGHKDARIYELDGFDHGSMAHPAHFILLEYLREINLR